MLNAVANVSMVTLMGHGVRIWVVVIFERMDKGTEGWKLRRTEGQIKR